MPLSLVEAVEGKYGNCETPIGIFAPRHSARKQLPRLLILNDCDVESAGDEEKLQRTISDGVLEIDLAQNRLSEWTEVSKILKFTPSVTFLNLSFNNLSAQLHELSSAKFPPLPRLTALILIGTRVSWDSVWQLVKKARNLQELHLSLNDFDCVHDKTKKSQFNHKNNEENDGNSQQNTPEDNEGPASPTDSPTEGHDLHLDQENDNDPSCGEDSGNGSSDDEDPFIYPHMRKIMFDGNPIGDWEQVAKLGRCFPHLKHIGLSDCPLTSVPPDAAEHFENLQSISLSNTLLSDYEDISNLCKFPALNEMRLSGVPFLNELCGHEKRQMLIALMPKIKGLNGTPVSFEERENSERAFIRKFTNSENPPQRYFDLLSIHGELSPLVDIHLKPKTRVTVRFCHILLDKQWEIFDKKINLLQTTFELKRFLEPITGLHPSKARLFYIDAEMRGVMGREEMKFAQKQLYSYNMQDGDEIIIESKGKYIPSYHHKPPVRNKKNKKESSEKSPQDSELLEK